VKRPIFLLVSKRSYTPSHSEHIQDTRHTPARPAAQGNISSPKRHLSKQRLRRSQQCTARGLYHPIRIVVVRQEADIAPMFLPCRWSIGVFSLCSPVQTSLPLKPLPVSSFLGQAISKRCTSVSWCRRGKGRLCTHFVEGALKDGEDDWCKQQQP